MDLIPADALMLLAAHTSRARIYTEWMDPAVAVEAVPAQRVDALDLFRTGGQSAPFTEDFVRRYREAQIVRNRKITEWVKERLKEIKAGGDAGWQQMQRDEGFIVHCTQADPRRLDLTLDPNDRVATSIAALASENHSPAGLGRFCTLRSWLSQWSYDESRADTLRCVGRVKVPVFILGNGADHLCCPSNQTMAYNAVSHQDKELYMVKDANHYLVGQNLLLKEVVTKINEWLRKHQML